MEDLKENIAFLLLELFRGKAALAGVKDLSPDTPLAALKLDSVDYVRALMKVRSDLNPGVSPEGLISLPPDARISDLAGLFALSPA